MEQYNIIITPDAEDDLNEIDDYITYVLLAPSIAKEYVSSIKQKLLSLEKSPQRYRLVEDEPWYSRGVRRMNARNFAVFYSVLEEYREVYIQNVIYQKRDLKRILMDIEQMRNDP